ncbi:MAG: TolC family protein [Geobacteraceae bacterium]|nr:TolC family protein [Geobacteraceae bacterium]
MLRTTIFMITLLTVATAAHAAPQILTLEQALSIALEKSREVARAGEYGKSVQGRYIEERAAALPQISLNSAYTASEDRGMPIQFGGGMKQYDSSLGLSFSQPLYTWGKIGAAIKAAEIGLQTSDEQMKLARQVTRRDVTIAFTNLLLAKELLRVANEEMEQKKRHHDESRNRFAAGVATDYDILAAEVAVENAVPAQIRAENQLKISKERLRFNLAVDYDVDAIGELAPKVETGKPFADALKQALDKRPELKDLNHRIGIYGQLVEIASAENKPRIDMKGSGGWHRLEMGDMRSSGALWNVGVFLSFPFFDGMRSDGKVMQAKSDLASKEIEKRQLVDSIRLQVETSLNDLREAGEIYQALSGTVRQAEKLLSMAEKGFEFGVKIRLEVEDAQTNLLKARVNRAKAAADYLMAKANLDWAMGGIGE